jgi:hypothetical protein
MISILGSENVTINQIYNIGDDDFFDDNHIDKPFDLRDLKERIDMVFRR